jgi:hypothetical protein
MADSKRRSRHSHDLRHEVASRWYEQTQDLVWVSQALLDHSALEQASRYLHVVLAGERNQMAARSWTSHDARNDPERCPPCVLRGWRTHGPISRTVRFYRGCLEPAVGLEPTTC